MATQPTAATAQDQGANSTSSRQNERDSPDAEKSTTYGAGLVSGENSPATNRFLSKACQAREPTAITSRAAATVHRIGPGATPVPRRCTTSSATNSSGGSRKSSLANALSPKASRATANQRACPACHPTHSARSDTRPKKCEMRLVSRPRKVAWLNALTWLNVTRPKATTTASGTRTANTLASSHSTIAAFNTASAAMKAYDDTGA